MAKAILVMDEKDYCVDCDLSAVFFDERVGRVLKCVKLDKEVGGLTKPADCPLIPAIGYVQPVGHVVSWEDDSDE